MKKCLQEFEIINDITYVYITRQNGIRYTVLFDTKDWNWLKDYTLRIDTSSKSPRVIIRDANTKQWLVHRIIMNAPVELEVDHIEGNTLDNRKHRLRLCTRQENMQNRHYAYSSSKEQGVYWNKGILRWVAHCTINSYYNYLGSFKTIDEASNVVKEFRKNNCPFSKEARNAA